MGNEKIFLNAYVLLKKYIFGNGGMREIHQQWGGQEMIIKNGGVYPSKAKNGGTPARPKAVKKGTPLSLFWHLP